MTDPASRKADHLDLCATDDVAFKSKTTLFDDVDFIHDALPELDWNAIDLGVDLVGKRLRAPLVIAAMTGGLDRAERVNRDLAGVAEVNGLAFGFGSMRPLLQNPAAAGYRVREEAPTAVLFGNLGVVQARACSTQQVADLVGYSQVDALCVHLNPAMEVVQPGGDSDFRGGIETITRLVNELSVPVIVKETGSGLSRDVGKRLVSAGVRWVDTSGAGGTSWVGVETLRAKATKELGERFWDWGIPTAASVLQLRGLGLGVIATGGVRHGLDVAKAVALGAIAGGIARPFLQAHEKGGQAGANAFAAQTIDEIRLAMLLTGAGSVAELQHKPVILGSRLERWR